MKVAIIGAGLAGLSCAHELERNNISPDIFEMTDYIGENLHFTGVQLHMFNTPIWNPFKVIKNKNNINIRPNYELKEITMFAPSKSYTLRGNFGYIIKRGPENDTLEHQISSSIITPIKFNTFGDVDMLKHEYEHVIFSTGNVLYTGKLKDFNETFNAYVRIADVKGNFRTDNVVLWFNTEYAKHGYIYLVPYTEKEARLIHIASETNSIEFEKYWSKFLNECGKNLNIIETRGLIHRTGILNSNKDANVYYAGYAGGLIDSFLGFGAFNALFSGIKSANCIIHTLNYDKSMSDIKKDIVKKHEYRIAYNHLDNDGIDKLIATICAPGIRQAIYNNPLARAIQGVIGVRLYNVIKHNK